MYIDPILLGAIGIVWTTAIGAIGWIFRKVWKDRGDLQERVYKNFESLLIDNDRRRDLWEKHGAVIDKSTDATKDLTREVTYLRNEVGSCKQEILRLTVETLRLQRASS